MTAFPTHVTHAQMKAVCDTLGLRGNQIRTLILDASQGLTATAYVLQADGKLVVGPDGEAATTTVHAPVGPDRAPAAGGLVTGRFDLVGEGGTACCLPHRDRPPLSSVVLEFDSSPEAIARVRDALRRPGRPPEEPDR
ncbi:hypothetical protein BX265_6177 [Streptomyces sp. TLI_235]|nr:hypothetical protein [Streptomyces sp. TLI_235]PBC71567.1 hypothetical protein BX265_6177 [Streptomyces sp. TLI_235]